MSDELAKVVVAVLREAGLRVADEGMRVEDVAGGSLVQVKLLAAEVHAQATEDEVKKPEEPAKTEEPVETSTEKGAVDGTAEEAK